MPRDEYSSSFKGDTIDLNACFRKYKCINNVPLNLNLQVFLKEDDRRINATITVTVMVFKSHFFVALTLSDLFSSIDVD